jgi:hypothetical protein
VVRVQAQKKIEFSVDGTALEIVAEEGASAEIRKIVEKVGAR